MFILCIIIEFPDPIHTSIMYCINIMTEDSGSVLSYFIRFFFGRKRNFQLIPLTVLSSLLELYIILYAPYNRYKCKKYYVYNSYTSIYSIFFVDSIRTKCMFTGIN